jgi:hypothetical protein
MRNRDQYPKNWRQTSLSVRTAANWRCEQCDRPCRRPGEDWITFAIETLSAFPAWYAESYEEVTDDETGECGIVEKPGRFTLTVSHRDRNPSNGDRANLWALCAPCHLRYDIQQHVTNASKTRSRKRDDRDRAIGQLSIDITHEEHLSPHYRDC